MAAPTVTGSLNLLTQLHCRLADTNTVQPMLASTLRGLAIHTAGEAGDHPGPDDRFGWGLFNGLAAANLITNNHHSGTTLAHIKEVPLNDRNLVKFPVVARGGEPLKVTVCWTDPAPMNLPAPALDPTNRMLVNNVDLFVTYYTNINSTNRRSARFYPWILDPANPTNAATIASWCKRNCRDNVEQVVVQNPVTNGIYEALAYTPGKLIFSTNSIVSGRTSTNLLPMTDQWVSLFVSGNVPQPELSLTNLSLRKLGAYTSVGWPSVVGGVYQVDCRTNMTTAKWELITGEIVTTRTNAAVWLHSRKDQSYYRVCRVR